MDQNEKWLQWAVSLQAIAQAGLYYGRDPYDRERYGQIREIAAEIIQHQTDLPMKKVRDLFCCETGYQTPKIDTRAAIFQRGKILLVHEAGGAWALPGGWVDVDKSVAENAVKEVKEEAGLDSRVKRIIAVQDREKHNLPIYAYKICKIFLECELLGGGFVPNPETTGYDWFAPDALPPLAEEKNTAAQIRMCFQAMEADTWEAVFD